LKTLHGLASELKGLARRPDWAWLGAQSIQNEIDASVVQLTAAQSAVIEHDAEGIRQFGDAKF
jgi:hypothetical protein